MAPSTPLPPGGRYRGRFAPSPTGPLHFGSLVAALGSHLDARAHAGEWLLRIEDIDAPRNVVGASAGILRALDAFGFEWDGEPLRQSERLDRYEAALQRLRQAGLAYPCACSRREIAASPGGPSVDGGRVYPGTCRSGLPAGRSPRAWRLRVPDEEIDFDDRIQGRIAQNLERAVGDFVLLRADGQFAYQLAVVVDDAAQGVTDVVRGADLLDSTPRQRWLQRCLGAPEPRYAHLPVAANAAGEKLSKQTLAPAIDASRVSELLVAALAFLGQRPPAGLARAGRGEVWQWAREHWSLAGVPRQRVILLAD